MNMLPLPTLYRSENVHQVMLHQKLYPARELETLEERLADCLRFTRYGLDALDRMPLHIREHVAEPARCAREFLCSAEVINLIFQEALSALVTSLDGVDADEKFLEPCAKITADLRSAHEISQRIHDLLAAEKTIAAWRKSDTD
jgi:hypothetical protein